MNSDHLDQPPVSAVYELPVPIWVVSSTLGETFTTGYAGVEFDVIMPADAPPHGTAPDLPGLESRPELTGDVEWACDHYGAFIRESLKPCVLLSRVGLNLTRVVGSPPPHRSWMGPADHLIEVIDDWFDALRTWAEVLTGQDLDPRHPVHDAVAYGAGLTFTDPGLNGAQALSIATSRVQPLQRQEWAFLLKRIRQGDAPPLEEVLSRDARASQRRDANRRAILEAASAVEIALSRYVRANEASLPERQRRRLDHSPTLGAYISIAQHAALAVAVPIQDLQQLSSARNDASHFGAEPSQWDTGRAVQTMINFLSLHGLYRRVATDESDGSEWIIAGPESS